MTRTNLATRFLMKTKSIMKVALAVLLLVTIASCRDTSKSAEQSAQASQNEAVETKTVDTSLTTDTFPEAPSSPVLDKVGVLSPEDVREITEEIMDLDSLGLAQVAVVIVDDLKGMKAHDYATALGNKWGVGHKEPNDGITIVVKPKTPEAKGEAAIATGLGMEKILSDEDCQLIINQKMIPEFKQEKYGKAIEEALDEIEDILTKKKD